MKESDLYLPVKHFLESQGYAVKGEIRDCDVMAVRGKEAPVIVELKQYLNLDVVLQAIDRQALSSKVYIGIPHNSRILKKRLKNIIKLMRMLGLGLLKINPDRTTLGVEVVIDPGDYRPRKSKIRKERLLGEFIRLEGDPNPGGSGRRKGIMTVYRQQALAIARFLDAHGPKKAAEISRALREPKARDIMYRNVYGWFERISLGIYGLSPRGKKEIALWEPGNKN